jgi:uncharacterized protein DUF4136
MKLVRYVSLTQNYRVGTLVLGMYDGNSKQLIWRGVSTDTLSNNPQHNAKGFG